MKSSDALPHIKKARQQIYVGAIIMILVGLLLVLCSFKQKGEIAVLPALGLLMSSIGLFLVGMSVDQTRPRIKPGANTSAKAALKAAKPKASAKAKTRKK